MDSSVSTREPSFGFGIACHATEDGLIAFLYIKGEIEARILFQERDISEIRFWLSCKSPWRPCARVSAGSWNIERLAHSAEHI